MGCCTFPIILWLYTQQGFIPISSFVSLEPIFLHKQTLTCTHSYLALFQNGICYRMMLFPPLNLLPLNTIILCLGYTAFSYSYLCILVYFQRKFDRKKDHIVLLHTSTDSHSPHTILNAQVYVFYHGHTNWIPYLLQRMQLAYCKCTRDSYGCVFMYGFPRRGGRLDRLCSRNLTCVKASSPADLGECPCKTL